MRPRLWLLPALAFVFGCATTADEPMEVPEQPVLYRKPDCPEAARPPPSRSLGRLGKPVKLPTFVFGVVPGALALTHAGAGSSPALADGPQGAAERAMSLLRAGEPALDSAIEAVVVLEDDPRFNAGTGSNIRLDGATIQMDAALMTVAGDFAAVAVIERVRNPIRVARLVLDSPHVLLAGEGATRFAHGQGVPDEIPVSDEARERYETRLRELGERVAGGVERFDWRRYWNFPGEMPAEMKAWREHGDTVGAVTRDQDGSFAATLSTGGTSVTLHGRVGDVPVIGAGLYAGPYGAVACTGHGESIVRRGLARRVYEAMASGTPARDAVYEVVADFPRRVAVGVIAVDRFGWAVASNTEMAHGLALEETEPGAVSRASARAASR